jgi:hypothetical protein
MPRPLRIDYPGALHHVMNRGARHEQVFFDDDSYGMFLSLVGNVAERYVIRIHGFALLLREDRENYHSGVLIEWMLELNVNESI